MPCVKSAALSSRERLLSGCWGEFFFFFLKSYDRPVIAFHGPSHHENWSLVNHMCVLMWVVMISLNSFFQFIKLVSWNISLFKGRPSCGMLTFHSEIWLWGEMASSTHTTHTTSLISTSIMFHGKRHSILYVSATGVGVKRLKYPASNSVDNSKDMNVIML